MTDEELVRRLHDGFRTGAIPRSVPTALVGKLKSRETIVVNGGRGQPCSACTERIGASEEGSIEYRYPLATVHFHRRCQELWDVEREKPVRKRVTKVRELKRRSGAVIVSCWPPLWASPYGRGSKLATSDEGILRSMRRVGDRLSLTTEYDGRQDVGSLEWDAPPRLEDVERVLRAHIGETLRSIGELEV